MIQSQFTDLGSDFRKYLVLAGITVFATAGDSLLARGMKDLGSCFAAPPFRSAAGHPQSLGKRGNPVAAGVFRLLHVRPFVG